MRTFIRLIIDATTQSWGSYALTGERPTHTFPTRSGVVGLVGNALGLDRLDVEALDSLHRSLRVSSRVLRKGTFLTDYHKKDFCDPGGSSLWDNVSPMTTRGKEKTAREFLRDRRGTFIEPLEYDGNPKLSNRQYLNGWAFEVVLEVLPDSLIPAPKILEALKNPVRALYFGRKTCLPLRPLVEEDSEVIEAESPMDVFAIPSPPPWQTEPERPWYPLGDPSKELHAHMDEAPEGDFQVLPQDIYDNCHSVNGRIFHPRRVYHVTRNLETSK